MNIQVHETAIQYVPASIAYDSLGAELEKAKAMPDALLMTTEAAARFLSAVGVPIAPLTLVRHRCVRSDGPRFRKIGRRVVYQVADLRAYAHSVGADIA